jgi:hypothetical protein
MRTPDEAFEYLTRLKEILLYCGVSDCNMEEGSLRCDANISVMLKDAKQYRHQNRGQERQLVSLRPQALEYEIERQSRSWNPAARSLRNRASGTTPTKDKTYGMRSKEQAHDYRYFPEPDLPPLVVGEAWQREILTALPELPEARRARMIAEYDINQQDAMTLTATRAFADSFEEAAKKAKSPKRVVSLITSELTGRLKAAGLELESSPVSLKGIVQAADLAESGELSSKMLKQLLDACFAEGKDFAEGLRARQAEADLGRGRDRGDDRRGDRGQSQAGSAVHRRQEDSGGVLRRQRDAAVEGTGESRAAQRTCDAQTGCSGQRFPSGYFLSELEAAGAGAAGRCGGALRLCSMTRTKRAMWRSRLSFCSRERTFAWCGCNRP